MATEPGAPARRSVNVWVVAVGAVLVSLTLGWGLSQVLPLVLIDFEHYYQASQWIWQGQNPYGVIEFFAPPWLALFLAPLLLLPIKLASGLWVIIGLASVAATTLLAQRWLGGPQRPWARLTSLVCMILTPAALFVYITGQISAVVALAVLAAGSELLRPEPRPWLLAMAMAIAAAKPNIIWLPAVLVGLQVVRQRRWRSVVATAALFAALAALSFVWLPGWPGALLAAWQGGAYRGGAGLVAAGYVGLPELGVPTWFFAPLLVYVAWRWWRDGLRAHVLALAFAVGLLVTPYSRSYDEVVLILPSIACLAAPGGARYWISLALMISAWIVPLFTLAVLAPVLMTMAVLVAEPAPAIPMLAAPLPNQANV